MAATTAAPAPTTLSEPSKYFKMSKKLLGNFTIRSVARSPPAELPEYVKTFTQILESKGYANLGQNMFDLLFDMYPKLYSSELSELRQNKLYSGLRNLFKCDVYHHGCYYSAPSAGAFREHLATEHPSQALYCLYCTKGSHDSEGRCLHQNDHATFNQPEQLVEHIKTEHSHLNYQCNLCLYRAFSGEHVFFHQALEHVDEFELSLHRAIRDKLDETGDISAIESAFLLQTNDLSESKSDDETEVEDNSEESVSSNQQKVRTDSRAKIIDCGDYGLDGDNRRAMVCYFNKHALDLENQALDEVLQDGSLSFLCAYCPVSSAQSGDYSYFHHHAFAHPDLPFLAYELQSVRKTRGLAPLPSEVVDVFDDPVESVDEEFAKQLITTFRERLGKDSMTRSYSEELMQNAFEYYQDLDWNSVNYVESTTDDDEASISQGVKRKRNEELEEANEEDSDTVTTTDETAPKRRRLFPEIRLPTLSETALRRTKRAASVVATAVAAVGFYHLTHFLPESIQTYLN